MAIADGLPPASAVQIPQGQVNYSPQAVQNALEATADGNRHNHNQDSYGSAAATNTAPSATNSPTTPANPVHEDAAMANTCHYAAIACHPDWYMVLPAQYNKKQSTQLPPYGQYAERTFRYCSGISKHTTIIHSNNTIYYRLGCASWIGVVDVCLPYFIHFRLRRRQLLLHNPNRSAIYTIYRPINVEPPTGYTVITNLRTMLTISKHRLHCNGCLRG